MTLGVRAITPVVLGHWNGLTSRDVQVTVYRFGSNICNAAQLRAFRAATVTPEATDRAGAAAEGSVQDIMRQLQATHQGLQAEAISWRILASQISRLPRAQQAAAISEGPIINVIHLFQLTPTQDGRRLQHIRQDAALSRDFISGAQEQLLAIRRLADNLSGQVSAFQRMLDTQSRALSALERSTTPVEVPGLAAVARGVEPQSDPDHNTDGSSSTESNDNDSDW